jgi:hypothetical protein
MGAGRSNCLSRLSEFRFRCSTSPMLDKEVERPQEF